MSWLQTIARKVGESPDDWLAKAEALGSVEMDSWCGRGKRVVITVGEYLNVQLRVTAMGDTNTAALRAAVEKATPIIETLMRHKEVISA